MSMLDIGRSATALAEIGFALKGGDDALKGGGDDAFKGGGALTGSALAKPLM
jgi:hypothetical protein